MSASRIGLTQNFYHDTGNSEELKTYYEINIRRNVWLTIAITTNTTNNISIDEIKKVGWSLTIIPTPSLQDSPLD